MMSRNLIESVDPGTVNAYAKQAYQTIDDFLGSGKSLDVKRPFAYGMISANPIAVSILDDIRKRVNTMTPTNEQQNTDNGIDNSPYSSGIRYTAENKAYYVRGCIYLVSTVIPSLAKYLFDRVQAFNDKSVPNEAVNYAYLVFKNNYLNASGRQSNNPMAVASQKFSIAFISAAELGTKSRPNTAVEDDTSASSALFNKFDNIVYRLNSAADFINAVLMATVGTDKATEQQVNLAANLLLARYVAEDNAIKNSGIPEMGRFLNNFAERTKSSLSKTKNVARIDDNDTSDSINQSNDDNTSENIVPKNIDIPEDKANQHTVISGQTRFFANSYIKLFAANFAERLSMQPTGSIDSKNPRVTQNDVMTAMRLIFKNCIPQVKPEQLTPKLVDVITADTLANNTDDALFVHQKMAEYVSTQLFDDLLKEYKSEKYCSKIIDTVRLIYLAMTNTPPDYLAEPVYGYGDYNANDRVKKTGQTSIGDELAALFVNDGTDVHIMNMNAKSKNNADNDKNKKEDPRLKRLSTISLHEIDSIPLSDIRSVAKNYQSPKLVLIKNTWGVLNGIVPASEVTGEDFEDAKEISPLVTNVQTRLGDQDPAFSLADLKKKQQIVKSRIYTADNRRKLKNAGFATGNESGSDLENLANTVLEKATTVADGNKYDVLPAITRTAAIAKAFTNVVNTYIRSCTNIKSDALTSIQRKKIYEATPTAEAFVIQGQSAVDFAVYRFLTSEKNRVGSATNKADQDAVTALTLAIKNAIFLRDGEGEYDDKTTNDLLNKTVGYFDSFASWNAQAQKVKLDMSDNAIVNADSGQISNIIKLIVNPETTNRWSGYLKTVTNESIDQKTGDPIVDQEIANRNILIDGWNTIFTGSEYTTDDLYTVQDLCDEFAKVNRPYEKFNELYTPTQLLITLSGVGEANQTDIEADGENHEFEYDNVPTENLTQAAPVSIFDKENRNALDLNQLDENLDDNSLQQVYGDEVDEQDVAKDPIGSFDDVISKIKIDTNPYRRAMELLDTISVMKNTINRLNDQLGVLTEDDSDLTETQQNAVWDLQKRIKVINGLVNTSTELLDKETNRTPVIRQMITAIKTGSITPIDVKKASHYWEVAHANADSRYNVKAQSENAYTNDDVSTVSHVVTVLGNELFSPSGMDISDVYDNIKTIRTYVGNASGNPGSMKVINYVMDAVGKLVNADETQVYVGLVSLINKIGRIIASDDNVIERLDNTSKIHDANKDAYAKDDELDNPIDAFARARLRPKNFKTTGIVSDAEKAERLAFKDNLRAAMSKNLELAKYAYALGKAMETFEHSIVDDDERYSDNERAERMFNSIESSLINGNMLYGEIAPSLPQRIIYNAIFDDERAGKLNYPATMTAVNHMANGYNLRLLAKEFVKPGGNNGRTTGAEWASKRDKATFTYSNTNNSLTPVKANSSINSGVGIDPDVDKSVIIASWFNPDNPITFNLSESESTGDVIISKYAMTSLVKSARRYICSKIADNIGKIDEMTGEVTLSNKKTSDALKSAVKSIHALADDLETPIADVIVATTSLGQKSARAGLIDRAKTALINNDESYTIEDMGDIASETNVFPERVSKDLSKVDQDWVEKMTSLVAAIPDELSIKDVMAATMMYCGSRASQMQMMTRPSFKAMFSILRQFQNMNSQSGAPIGYFGDTSDAEVKNLQTLIENICSFKRSSKTWSEAAAKMKNQLMASIDEGNTSRRVGTDLPSSPARQRLAHLRMDPNYSVKHGLDSNVLVKKMNLALTRSNYLSQGKSSQTVRFTDYDLVIDVKTLVYWLYIASNQMLSSGVDMDDIYDEDFVNMAESYMDNIIMTYITGVSPKRLGYVKNSASESKVPESIVLGEDMMGLTNTKSVNSNMVYVDGVGLLTKDAYVAAVRTAYDMASAEANGKPSDQDIAQDFNVQMGVLTGKSYNRKTNSYDSEAPVYDVDKLPKVNRPKETKQPTVIKQPEKDPKPQPVEETDKDDEFQPEVHAAND